MLAVRQYPLLILIGLVAADKLEAKLKLLRRRVPENTLCLFAIASGGAGAVLGAVALGALNHKTRKRSFQLKYTQLCVKAWLDERLETFMPRRASSDGRPLVTRPTLSKIGAHMDIWPTLRYAASILAALVLDEYVTGR